MREKDGTSPSSTGHSGQSDISGRTRCQIDRADPVSLADFFAMDGLQEARWSDRDLEAMLRHQLRTRLDAELAGDDDVPEAGEQTTAAIDESGATETFAELFSHEQPPVELLAATRRFAKACRQNDEGRVPAEIATVLYIASIVAARVKLDVRISSLDDAALRYGLDWALKQPWLVESLRHLLQQGANVLQEGQQDRDA
jgi:hypothetical protein